MKMLLIGYGKMGKAIETLAIERNHSIACIIDQQNVNELTSIDPTSIDVAFEFSTPASAFQNIKSCLKLGIPIISGTTGWLSKKAEVEQICTIQNGTFFYASNFSIGVNLFIKISNHFAELIKDKGYSPNITEIHHQDKKDTPSGTAITLAQGLIKHIPRLHSWTLDKKTKKDQISINSIREEQVAGTHTVNFTSDDDRIIIQHEAFSRVGFSKGAILVAEWMQNKKGIFSMDDFLAG